MVRTLPALLALLFACGVVMTGSGTPADPVRPRARDLGITAGVFPPGPVNAITDVDGVRVGHVTLDEGDAHTGVTAILPHGGNMFTDRVPAAIVVGNGFGKLVGLSQVAELGELETPILLTNTLQVWDAAAAMVDHVLAHPENRQVRSVNPVVGETNDGWLNEIRARPLKREHFLAALASATGGSVAEGSVGAGRGTQAFGYKGGIGTSSRVLSERFGGYTVGVLVQSNFGGLLTIDGVPIGKELGRHPFGDAVGTTAADGSCMIVVATDAPMDARQLRRLAARALAGMARTGSSFSHGSGDYVIAFTVAGEVRRRSASRASSSELVADSELSALFQATAEATEEAIYNSILRATTVHGREGHVAEAIPIEMVRAALSKRRTR